MPQAVSLPLERGPREEKNVTFFKVFIFRLPSDPRVNPLLINDRLQKSFGRLAVPERGKVPMANVCFLQAAHENVLFSAHQVAAGTTHRVCRRFLRFATAHHFLVFRPQIAAGIRSVPLRRATRYPLDPEFRGEALQPKAPPGSCQWLPGGRSLAQLIALAPA